MQLVKETIRNYTFSEFLHQYVNMHSVPGNAIESLSRDALHLDEPDTFLNEQRDEIVLGLDEVVQRDAASILQQPSAVLLRLPLVFCLLLGL